MRLPRFGSRRKLAVFVKDKKADDETAVRFSVPSVLKTLFNLWLKAFIAVGKILRPYLKTKDGDIQSWSVELTKPATSSQFAEGLESIKKTLSLNNRRTLFL